MIKRLLFYNFRFVYRLDNWLRQHFTSAGMLILGALVASAIFGIDTRQTLAYQLFALTASLLLLAMLSAWTFRFRGEAQRQLPQFATVGEKITYRLRLTHLGKRPQRGLLLRDELAQTLPNYAQFSKVSHHVVGRRNWVDDYIGYPRWIWLLNQRRGGYSEEIALEPLPAGQALECVLELTPVRRGYLQFSRLRLGRPDPLGLFKALRYLPAPDRLLVLPRRYEVPPIQLPGHRKYQRGGVQLASSVGDAVEFTSLREYRPGDPLRHIHWKSFARLNKPVVKEYEDEFFVRHALVLDTFADARLQDAFEEAVSVASSFVCRLMDKETLLDFMFVGTQAYCFTAGRGLVHLDNMLEIIACVERCEEREFSYLPPLVMGHVEALSSCICILLSWDAERRRLIEQLLARQLPLLVLLIAEQAPQDADYPFFHTLRPGHIAADLDALGKNFSAMTGQGA